MVNDFKEKLAILVVSCDNYSDLWGSFFELFWRFWPDCPFCVYLVSNKKKERFSNVINIVVGEDKSWSSNLLLALDQVKEDYVLMHLEDLFFYKKINNEKIIKLIKWVVESGANYVRMNPTPKPDKHYNKLVGLVSKGSIYRASTVMSIWKKSVLQDLLNPKENAWEFETYGTERSDGYDKFYAASEPILPVLNGVIKGKWQRSAVDKIKALGIEPDFTKRKVMTFGETIMLHLLVIRSMLLGCIPARYQRRLKELLVGRKCSYKGSA